MVTSGTSFIIKRVEYNLNSSYQIAKHLSTLIEFKSCWGRCSEAPVILEIRQKQSKALSNATRINHLQLEERLAKALRLTQQLFLEQPDNNGETALFHAIRAKSLNNLKLLLQYGADTYHLNKAGKTAADICYRMHAWDCLLLLLQNGSPFPLYFDENHIHESGHELVQYIKANNEISMLISHGTPENIVSLVNNGAIAKNFRNIKNQSAILVAFINRQFRNYVLLKTSGFKQTCYEAPIDVSTLSSMEKLLLKNEMAYFVKKCRRQALTNGSLII